MVGTGVRTPFDIAKQSLQVQGSLGQSSRSMYRDTLGTFRHILSQEGPRGLLRGYHVTLLRDVPFAAIYFATYETLKVAQEKMKVYQPPLLPWSLCIDGDSAATLTVCRGSGILEAI